MNEDIIALRRELTQIRSQLAGLESRSRQGWGFPQTVPPIGKVSWVVEQTSHGFTVGQPLKLSGSTYALAKADTEANAQVVAVVGLVISTGVFVAIRAGIISGLSGKTAGARYFLSATTAGAVTTTAPAIKVPIYDAISATEAIAAIGGGGSSSVAPTEDGTVWCSKSDLSGGEWDKTVDIGTSAAGGGTLIVYFASGKYVEISATGVVTVFQSSTSKVEINASSTVTITYANSNTVTFASSDFVGTSKAVKLREINVCDAGVAKKMLVLASATY